MKGSAPSRARFGWRRRLGRRLVLLLALGLVLWLRGAESDDPNVILITVDTLRADRLGSYGHEAARTPHLDSLASRGRLFLNATTPLPRTTPALASMLTGLAPHHHGSREVSQPMEKGDTLAVVLRRRGYLTIGVSANATAGREQGFSRGFAAFRQADRVAEATGDVTTSRALALAPRRAGRPVFLWVHYIDPHFPYEPPRDWGSQPEAPRCREVIASAKEGFVDMGAVQGDLDGRSSAALEDCSRLYDEEIAYTDERIGHLLAVLEERGLLEGAIVVFTADHGENLGEEGLYFEHGPSLNDASLRVPLIVAGPGIAPGVDPTVARLEDLTPTLLGLLGLEPRRRPRTDGRDLSRRWRGEPMDPVSRALVATAESGGALHYQNRSFVRSGRSDEIQCVNGESLSLCWRPGEEPGLYDLAADPGLTTDLSPSHPEVRQRLEAASRHWGAEQARQRAVRTERFKLVERPTVDGTYARSLYDLDAPTGETVDVAHLHPEVAAELAARLDAWTTELPDFTPPERSGRELDVLRALGYVE